LRQVLLLTNPLLTHENAIFLHKIKSAIQSHFGYQGTRLAYLDSHSATFQHLLLHDDPGIRSFPLEILDILNIPAHVFTAILEKWEASISPSF
jgi:hypothetical protein